MTHSLGHHVYRKPTHTDLYLNHERYQQPSSEKNRSVYLSTEDLGSIRATESGSRVGASKRCLPKSWL